MTTRIGTVVRCADLPHRVYATLRSIERQQGGPGEIVLVADSSTPDRVKPWLRELAAARGHIFLDTVHVPTGAVRNMGIGAAVSRHVMCLDAGDILDRSFHEVCGGVLDQDDGVHLVTTCVLMLGPGSERRIVPAEAPDDLESLVGDTSLAHSASLIRRDTWSRLNGFDETLSCLDDYDLFLRVLQDGRRGVFIDRPLLIRAWRTDALHQRNWGTEPRLEAFRTIVARHAARFAKDPVAVLYPREHHLHETAKQYRSLLARHDEARAEIGRLETTIEQRRGSLSEKAEQTVTFGDLRRTSPIARNWGYERGTPVDRHYIESFLRHHRSDIRGSVLEVQEADYSRQFGGNRVTESDVVDLNADNPRATVITDMRCAVNVPSNTYDCLIITQTLHVIDDMSAVVRECERILKPGGVLLATLPCVSRVCLEYGHGGDFWRVTVDGARQLFGEYFALETLEIEGRGNTLVSTAFLYGLAGHELDGAEFEVDDPYNPMLVTVRAVKSASTRQTTSDRAAARVEPVHTLESASRPRLGAAILLYHSVGDVSRELDPHGLVVSVREFQAQMTHVRNRFTVVPLSELSEAVRANATPDNAIAVTFDDGYLDNLTVASPILGELDLPATFFVTTDRLRRDESDAYEYWWDALADCCLGDHPTRPIVLQIEIAKRAWRRKTGTRSDRLAAHRDLYALLNDVSPAERRQIIDSLDTWSGRTEPTDPSRRRMTADEIIELARRPGHSVGNHSVRHLVLPNQPADVHRAEIEESKAALERLLDTAVSTFAYPFGAVDDRVIGVARFAGFHTGVTCEEGPVTDGLDTLQLPRLEVSPDLGQPFDRWLQQRLRR